MKHILAAMSLALAATTSPAAGANFHPTKPVTLIVPYTAGGGTDVVGRLFAKELGEMWGQPVLVENRTGASGTIGAGFVAKAAPDGHTLLLSVASIAINPYVLGKLPYNTKTDFTPITVLAKPVVVMVGSPGLKATDIRSFVALAKKEPGVYTFASSEPSTRLYGERLADEAQIKLVNIPYKGAQQWLGDIMGNLVDTGFGSITSVLPMMKDGRMKVLGIAAARRSELLPNVPTFSEQGVTGLDSRSWYGLFGPGRLPAATAAAIHADVATVLAKPAIQARLAELGAEPGGEAPEAFAQRFQRELVEYGELTRKLGIQAERTP
ncbi:Bug family tripartite tricarboxylate transporter substrate binding protein [Variovorax sp. LARHSF232]